jgi:hypothetical protein
MGYNKSIIPIFAIFCIFIHNTTFASMSPAPRDEEASTSTLLSNSLSSSVIRSEATSPAPYRAFPIIPATVYEEELFDSIADHEYEPKTPSSATRSTKSKATSTSAGEEYIEEMIPFYDLMIARNELQNQINTIKERFLETIHVSPDVFARNLEKLRAEEALNLKTSVHNSEPLIQELSQYAKRYWPTGNIEIIEPTEFDHVPNGALTGVYGNAIILFPDFFQHNKKTQLADILTSIEHIKVDDFYIANLMNDYCNEKHLRLSASTKRECQNLMAMNEFLCIQSGYVKSMMATQDPIIQRILKQGYDRIQRKNEIIIKAIAELDVDQKINHEIESMVNKTRADIKARDAQILAKTQALQGLIHIQAKKPKRAPAAKKPAPTAKKRSRE